MKNFFTVVVCMLLLGINSIYAQQIKGDFNKQTDWGVQTSFSGPDPTFTDMGITPDGWNALNVTQMGLKFPLVFSDGGRAGTDKSLKMMNRKLGAFGIGANSPSYVTLGTTWVYADILGVMSQLLGDKSDPDDSNGGSLGGIDFCFRPDSIVGYYKRSHGEQNPDEIAQIIMYSWIGTCKSYSPIGDGMDATPSLPKVALVDRDVDILGVANGGKPANGVTLVGKQVYSITGNLTDWTRISLPVDYLRPENPLKMNIIITSADYFNRPNIGAENKLWADDVRFIYNSKLKSVTIAGQALDGFDEDVMEYVLPATDANKAVMAVAFGKNAKVTISDLKDSKRVITVVDGSAAGVKSYTYTLVYKGAPTQLTWNEVNQADCVYGKAISIKPVSANTEGKFTYELSNPAVAEVIAGDTLRFIGVGEVKVIARQSAAGDYSPSILETPLVITVKKAPLTIGVKNIERVYNYSNDKFEFTYDGLRNGDASDVDKIFTVKPTASIPEQTLPSGKVLTTSRGVYVGEYPISVAGAEALNYEIAYTNGTLKVTPAEAIVIGIKAASMSAGQAIPALTVDYAKLIGEDKLDPALVFSVKPTLTTIATQDSPAGLYDITFATEGTFTDVALKNYKGITFAAKGTLTIKVVKTQPVFEDIVGFVKQAPKAQYEYAGYTDVLGKIEVYDVNGNRIDDSLLTFGSTATTILGVDKATGEYRLWGSVNNATGDVDITVTVKETDTTLPVTGVVCSTKVIKKQAVVKPADFALKMSNFKGNMADAIPVYAKSEDIIERDLATFGLAGAFNVYPTLNIETPDGVIKLSVDPDKSGSFLEDAVAKLHALPVGNYSFTLGEGSSTQYDYTFDNTVKGTMLVPNKSTVVVKGIDNLAYGRKEPFKFDIKANGTAITVYTVTENHIKATDTKGEYNVLTPGTDTLTFVIPATDTTVEETYSHLVTVNKAVLTITPKSITCEESAINIPDEYEIEYDGFVNDEDQSFLTALPIAYCQISEGAKAGDTFAILLFGAEAEKYDLVYKEGLFSVIKDSGIETGNMSDAIRVYAWQGNLYIKGNENAQPISVYTVQGTLVARYEGHESVIQTRLLQNTIYIVRVGNVATRVMMR